MLTYFFFFEIVPLSRPRSWASQPSSTSMPFLKGLHPAQNFPGPSGKRKKFVFRGAGPEFKPQASHRYKMKSISKSKHLVFLNCCPAALYTHSLTHNLLTGALAPVFS